MRVPFSAEASPRRVRNGMSHVRRPPGERGSVMLLALGVVVLVTLGVGFALQRVGGEATVQAESRRSKEAFFAAEAGLAEGRERVRLLRGAAGSYTPVITALSTASTEIGDAAAGDPWYDVLGWTSFPLSRCSSSTDCAVDDGVTDANRELRDDDGTEFGAFPGQAQVRYRVFLTDDHDESGTDDQTVDANGQVWLTAVGEVQTSGGQSIRASVRTLVSHVAAGSVVQGYTAQKGFGAEKSFGQTFDAAAPDVSLDTNL